MKVHFISDTHNDFWVKEVNPQSPKFDKQIDEFINILNPSQAEVLIIAGDLGHYFKQDTGILLKLKKYYKHIIFVIGNHDLYLVSNSIEKKYKWDSFKRVKAMKDWCSAQENIHLLDGDVIEINGYKFGGLGMSWDYSFGKSLNLSEYHLYELWKSKMNDSRLIFQDGIRSHSVPLAYGGSYSNPSFDVDEYFNQQRIKLDNIKEVDVMVTHYAPILSDDSKYKDDGMTTFYMFDGLCDIERLNPIYWIHGHMHSNVDDIVAGTNILCNPLGYPGENTYTSIKEIELENR